MVDFFPSLLQVKPNNKLRFVLYKVKRCSFRVIEEIIDNFVCLVRC